jgi:ATP-binding cassette subfamily B protein
MDQLKLPITIWGFFWYFIKKQKKGFFILLLTMGCWALQESVYPYFIGLLIDKASEYNGEKSLFFSYLAPTLITAGSVVLFIEFNYRVFDYLSAKIYPKYMADVRSAMYNYVLGHSHQYFSENFAGTIASKIARMPEGAQRIVDLVITMFFPIILSFIFSAVVLARTSPIFALIVTAWFVLHVGFTFLFARKSKELAITHSHKITKLNGKIVDCLGNIVNVRLFSRYDYEREYYARGQQEEYDAYNKSMIFNANIKLFLAVFTLTFMFSMVGGALYCYNNDIITIGDLALVLSYQSLIGLVWMMGMEIVSFYELTGNCSEALNIINRAHDIRDTPDARRLKITDGSIVFDHVTFNYARNNNVFKDKSITIKAKEKVGLVGFSGSGKTTFVNLILRYFDINNGKILIDGQDITKVTQDSLRRSISLIPQESMLFHRSLIENIRYGKIDATDDEVVEAAKRAHAHEFILKLSDKYYTMVGERGMKLSGGQRQRIAIARAILKDAPILILDEATSALDSVTEKEIQESLDGLMQGKTVMVIAHRLSTLLNMDRILVFDKGTIVEDGSHQELIDKEGHYAKLWNMQAGGFLPCDL